MAMDDQAASRRGPWKNKKRGPEIRTQHGRCCERAKPASRPYRSVDARNAQRVNGVREWSEICARRVLGAG